MMKHNGGLWFSSIRLYVRWRPFHFSWNEGYWPNIVFKRRFFYIAIMPGVKWWWNAC